MFILLFETYLDDLNKGNYDSMIYQDFLNKMNDSYNNNTSNTRKVIDYIAGMTDDYMQRQDTIIKARKKM